MRSLLAALALVLTTVLVAPAQQLAPSEPELAVESEVRPVVAPSVVGSAEWVPVPLTPASVQMEQTASAVEARTAAQISAQTVLALLGAVVVVVALVALFN